MKRAVTAVIIVVFTGLLFFSSCKKDVVEVLDFSKYTSTDNDCSITGPIDSTAWKNDVLNRTRDTARLIFSDDLFVTDSMAGTITLNPPCPNPSDGLFIWNINTTRQCKLKVVCINLSNEVIYYNAYRLVGGKMTVGFNFKGNSAFKAGNNYRLYFAFYTATDSLYYSGHGDFRIE
ncbi:MAG TPA: hypothetical protein VG603_05365 [Chitinophagales bacterium]|nr:hypothetical protein [Chitinophagales bacterium]